MGMEYELPFYQPENFYREDPYFAQLMEGYLPPGEFSWAREYFSAMGKLAGKKISPLVLVSDQNPPVLQNYDAQGHRIDQIQLHETYREIARLSIESGLIGLGHSPDFKKNNRRFGPLLKFGLGYLYSQAGSVYYCPVCMTDGTLQLIAAHGSEEMKQQWIPRLTSMDFAKFSDGGMYLTEIQGGSDVGANTCRAYQENGQWKISGKKWFCSNAGSQTAMVLARPDGFPSGTAGLGLFLVPLYLEEGARNAIFIDRLKPKLGTCEMPTAEITFEGAIAYPVGKLEAGFAYMTEMLNLSRTYNAIWSIGLMQRAYLEARYYAEHRRAFGKAIEQYPLVAKTILEMKQDSEKALGLVLETIHYWDRIERGHGTKEDEILLRMLTPVIKFYTAEKCMEAAHRAIEIFGGNGCIEDFPVAKILRDSQILAIWEGTANILSLDLLRVVKKQQAHQVFLKVYGTRLEKEISGASRAPLLQRWKDLEALFQAVDQGQDGIGGQRDCRALGVSIAQFIQEFIWTRGQRQK
jgi:alkylation response protein AidB-like acyl-CoA dehydrogenase